MENCFTLGVDFSSQGESGLIKTKLIENDKHLLENLDSNLIVGVIRAIALINPTK